VAYSIVDSISAFSRWVLLEVFVRIQFSETLRHTSQTLISSEWQTHWQTNWESLTETGWS